jgi:hypothetical protein
MITHSKMADRNVNHLRFWSTILDCEYILVWNGWSKSRMTDILVSHFWMGDHQPRWWIALLYIYIQRAHIVSLDRASPSEFVIPLAKYNKALYTQVSLGLRFRMLFETEDSGVRRYMGTITGIGDLDPVRWKNSHWRNLQVSHSSWVFTYSDIHVLQLPDSYTS